MLNPLLSTDKPASSETLNIPKKMYVRDTGLHRGSLFMPVTKASSTRIGIFLKTEIFSPFL